MSPEPLKSYSWWIMSTFSRIVSLESIAIAPMISKASTSWFLSVSKMSPNIGWATSSSTPRSIAT